MKILFKTLAIATVLGAGLSGCVISKDALPFRKFKSAIIPKGDKFYIPTFAPKFVPTKNELKKAETVLKTAFEKEMAHEDFEYKFPLVNYYRQYYGYFDEAGEKIVFVQCFEKSMANGDGWRAFIIHPDDGCNAIFRVRINLNTKTYMKLEWNTCA